MPQQSSERVAQIINDCMRLALRTHWFGRFPIEMETHVLHIYLDVKYPVQNACGSEAYGKKSSDLLDQIFLASFKDFK